MSLNHITNQSADKLDVYVKSVRSENYKIKPADAPMTLQGSVPVGLFSSIFNEKLQKSEVVLYNEELLGGTYKKVLKLRGSFSIQVDLPPAAEQAVFNIIITDIPNTYHNSTVEYFSGLLRTASGARGDTGVGPWLCTTTIAGQIEFSFSNYTHINMLAGEQRVVFEIDLLAS